LGFDFHEFFASVKPSWKLGIRFLWGDPSDSHFNYPFDSCMARQPRPLRKMPAYYCLADWWDASRCCALMDRGLSPCFLSSDGQFVIEDAHGYHIDNKAFIRYLTEKLGSWQIDRVEGQLRDVARADSGDIESIGLSDGRRLAADLFVDCSGFASRLLGQELNEPFVSYTDSLFCDKAVVGQWDRDDAVLPYTTAETMDHGWCWRIDFADHVTRGYVFSSQFCTEDEAIREFRDKNPALDEDVRVVRFRSGRYQNFWTRNVVALGNAAGFVEPLEATALHVLIEQIRLVCRMLSESDGRPTLPLQGAGNRRHRMLWDEVRDFLAIHYKFNRRSQTPFWRHCRASVNLAGAQELVELYQQAGPSTLCATVLPGGHVFGYDGFMALLIGQRVPTAYRTELSSDDVRIWNAYRDDLRRQISRALPMREALGHLCTRSASDH
jgi:tryptophan halogenase